MNPLTVQQIRDAVGGKALNPPSNTITFLRSITTDSRAVQPDALFIALRGEQFDGHAYLAQATVAGAVMALVDRPPERIPNGLHVVQVPDTRKALGHLAKFARKLMRAKVIAVGGSNGKTGAKLLIDAALRGRLKGAVSPKSYNNDIGVPMTILPASPTLDYLVLEIGTNHRGEISALSKIASPDIAVITNAGAEHLEGLGDLAGVRKENADIVDGLGPSGLLVVNGDDPDLLAALTTYRGRKLTFGFDSSNDLFAADVQCDGDGVSFRLNNSRQTVKVPLLGRHIASNALAAIAVARTLRVPEEIVIAGLAAATGPDMRLQLQPAGAVTILNDAYNANPSSMRAALEAVMTLPASGRRVLVLGDMLELGPAAAQYHREIGQFAATHCQPDLLISVGALARDFDAGAAAAGLDDARRLRFDDTASAAAAVDAWLRPGDLVLLKASRGMRLETIAAAISHSSAAGPIA